MLHYVLAGLEVARVLCITLYVLIAADYLFLRKTHELGAQAITAAGVAFILSFLLWLLRIRRCCTKNNGSQLQQ